MKLKIRKSSTLDELIRGCRKNNAAAQRELFERYSPRLLGLCRRYVGSIDDAEDIMINGFMKIFDRINQYSAEGSFEGWMSKVMVNESLTFIRRNKNMSVAVSLEKAQQTPENNTVLETLEAEELMKFIDEMPVGYRTVFNMYVLEGYSHREISELLGISEGASKSQLSRSKAFLRERISRIDKESKRNQHEK